jgi:polyferredoxin
VAIDSSTSGMRLAVSPGYDEWNVITPHFRRNAMTPEDLGVKIRKRNIRIAIWLSVALGIVILWAILPVFGHIEPMSGTATPHPSGP